MFLFYRPFWFATQVIIEKALSSKGGSTESLFEYRNLLKNFLKKMNSGLFERNLNHAILLTYTHINKLLEKQCKVSQIFSCVMQVSIDRSTYLRTSGFCTYRLSIVWPVTRRDTCFFQWFLILNINIFMRWEDQTTTYRPYFLITKENKNNTYRFNYMRI